VRALGAAAGAIVLLLGVTAMAAFTFMPWPAKSTAERAGRYHGLKQVGRDPYTYERFTIVIDKKGRVTAESATLADVKLTVDTVAMRVTAGRPSSLPERLSGRFVRRGPPANAKGPVEEGILFDGSDWFLHLQTE